jgi:hypothetical protein
LLIGGEGNCSDENGNVYLISHTLITQFIKINHKEDYPFKYSNSSLLDDYAKITGPIPTTKNSMLKGILEFTPIIYKTASEKFRLYNDNNRKTIIGTYLNNFNYITINNLIVNKPEIKNVNNIFFTLQVRPSYHIDVYEREYDTLIDILSAIGGLFSPIKLFFSFLIMFYSSYENNYQIVKNIILRKRIYENYVKRKVKIDKEIQLKVEKSLLNKKNKLNSCEHYFCSIFNCCSKRKTMKILKLCDNFVKEYLSADNIIFNSILFERYYKDNPINDIQKNEKIKEIETELYNYNDEDELFFDFLDNDT